MLCLKKSTVWPQKVVAETDVNQNPVDLFPKLHESCIHTCFEPKEDIS